MQFNMCFDENICTLNQIFIYFVFFSIICMYKTKELLILEKCIQQLNHLFDCILHRPFLSSIFNDNQALKIIKLNKARLTRINTMKKTYSKASPMKTNGTKKQYTGKPKRHNLSIFASAGAMLFMLAAQPNIVRAVDCPPAQAVDYVFENFNLVTSFEIPAEWCSDFEVRTTGGTNNTKRLTRQMAFPDQVSYWQTPPVSVQAGATLSFSYRMVDFSGYPNTATLASAFSMEVAISINGGSTFTPLETIGNGNHTVTTAYASKSYDLSAYAGNEVIVKLSVSYLGGTIHFADFDNVMIGNFADAEFTVENKSGTAIENATIDIDELVTLTTDATGKASTLLPPGTYPYSIQATNYYTLSNGSFIMGDVDQILPANVMIGNYTATFQVDDETGSPVQTANIYYEGQIELYNGVETISGNILTNASGIATAVLPDGTYSITVSKFAFYPETDQIIMDNAVQLKEMVIQSYPTVNFTVTDNLANPVQGVEIRFSESLFITTDVNGAASIDFPIGDYPFGTFKIGYYDVTGNFQVTSNDDLTVPNIVLEVAPATFKFVTKVEKGITFRNILVGQSSSATNIQFMNVGSGSLTINPGDISITGVDSDQFAISPAIIDPIVLAGGATGSIPIIFAPTSEGLKTAQLQIEDNTGGKNLQVVDIKGTGYTAVSLPFFDDFETDFSKWVVENGTQINQWYQGTAVSDGGNLSAIVSNNGGISNTYSVSGFNVASRSHFYMDFEIPSANPGDILLQFKWKGAGEAFLDILRVFLVETNVLPQAGTLLTGNIGTYSGNTNWQTVTYVIPAVNFGTTKRLVFSWINNGSSGTQPPIAIDDIYLGATYTLATAVSPAAAGTASGDGTYGGLTPAEVTATPATGYVFSHWSATAGSFADVNSANTTYTMPAESITITANFKPAAPTVTDDSYVYDGNNYSLAAEGLAGFNPKWYDAAEGGSEISAPNGIGVGEYTGWAVLVDANDIESERVQGTLSITPRPLSVTASGASKIYGNVDPTLSYEITTGTLVTGDALTGAISRDAGENVGLYGITQGTLSAGTNYEITFVGGIMEITARPVTLSATNASKVYGETDPLLTVELAQGLLISGDAITGIPAREAGENVGEYDILQGTIAISDNYSITFVPGVFTITPASLTIMANAVGKVYGEVDPEITYSISSGQLFFTDAITGTLSREAGETPGNYPITQGTLTAGDNYTISFTTAFFGITTKELTLGGTFTVADREYDGTTEAGIITNNLVLNGIVGTDVVTLANVLAAFANAGPAADIVVGIISADLAGAASDNYVLSLTGAPTATASITPLTYTLTVVITPENSGTVTGAGTFAEGAVASLEATPAENYKFVQWENSSSEVLGTATTLAYTMPAADATITAVFQSTISVDEIAKNSFSMFPNPARETVSIRSEAWIEEIFITDITGRMVFSARIDNTETTINTGSFNEGIYMVRIHTTEGVRVKKLQVR
jgi:hypothetical protein